MTVVKQLATRLREQPPGIPEEPLGNALKDMGDVSGAMAEFREAIRLKPDLANAHFSLGNPLAATGSQDAAIAEFHEAIRLNPDYAEAHTNLGAILRAKGDVDSAIIEFREAIRSEPDLHQAHNNLGLALMAKGESDPAIAEFHRSVDLEPNQFEAHANLGLVQMDKGDFDAAIEAWQMARDRVASNPGVLAIVESKLAEAERAKKLNRRLPAVIQGQDRPVDADEALGFALLCITKKLNAAASRFYTQAFSDRPSLVDDPQAQHTYNAACAATLAGCGQGKDDPAPNEAARLKLRQQALDWLKADLVLWTGLLDRDSKAAATVLRTLQHWKVDPDLTGVREPQELAKLPEAERASWRAVWEEVDRLIARAESR